MAKSGFSPSARQCAAIAISNATIAGCARAILSSCAESGLNIASRSDGVSISLQAEKQRSSVSANAVECWYIV